MWNKFPEAKPSRNDHYWVTIKDNDTVFVSDGMWVEGLSEESWDIANVIAWTEHDARPEPFEPSK